MKHPDILLSCEQAVEMIVMIHTEYVIRSHHFDDYFHVGWYVDVNIGQWDKSYKLVD